MFEERGGMLTVLGGLIALVLIATGFAVIVEKRSAAAKLSNDAEKSLVEERQTLELLQDEIVNKKETLDRIAGQTAINDKYVAAKMIADKNTAILTDLRHQKADLLSQYEKVGKDYSSYQKLYVGTMRKAAEDEVIESLKLKTGKEYGKVTITKVTPEGLEIRHEFGTARILAKDLDGKWNERFHWNLQTVSASGE